MIYAARGAIQIRDNTPVAIRQASAELARKFIDENTLEASDLVSILWTATDDLDAAFPALGARDIGLDQVAMTCAREIPVPGSLPMTIRALFHFRAPKAHEPRSVYLRGAERLRPDLKDPEPDLELSFENIHFILRQIESRDLERKGIATGASPEQILAEIISVPRSPRAEELQAVDQLLRQMSAKGMAMHYRSELADGWFAVGADQAG